MTTLAEIEQQLRAIEGMRALFANSRAPTAEAGDLLAVGEAVLEAWIKAKGAKPTKAKHESFRLLALHRQGAKGDPSFNACRETCRELVYHHNLIAAEPAHPETAKRLQLMNLVARHLLLFVSAKMETAAIGEFCCASKPVRAGSE